MNCTVDKMHKYYEIAGLRVKMNTFGRTAELAEPYSVAPFGEAEVTIEPDYGPFRRRHPMASDESCEYICSGRDFYYKLIGFDGFMLHASAIEVEGKAYLFSADSGVGKSTHTRLWQEVFGTERVSIINDDKPALRIINGVWHACGTPWCGKDGQNRNCCVPVEGICFLERAEQNSISPYGDHDIVYRILSQTYRSANMQINAKLLELLANLIDSVKLWHLCCNMEHEAARIAFEAMAGRTEIEEQ